ncbi:NAD(P)H-binding protein [Micromonospora sp. AMSO12t]|uniref:SDR family oxidoreductase n=2 Tax=Micromonospora TaxID=1873 RepID=UPI00124BBFF6|nr:NAD(P)H-binding protein [Micromonospora sp. AMSO12t]KAB1128408.1 NAD(P)H-binding protein [Micromonospora sp. AMSO12t]
MSVKRTVLVTGGTGRVGGQVVARLVEAEGVRVRVLSRDPARASAALGPQVEVVGGDLTVPDGLSAALDGVDALFLVFPSVTADHAAGRLVATLAERVGRIVYLSTHGVPDDPDGAAGPDGTILGSHAHLEGLLAGSAAEYAFLRSSGFAANTLAWAPQIQQSDVLRWFVPQARRALVHEADLGAVAARLLTDDRHQRAAHHLTGPEQLTQVDQLAAIGAALGRTLRYEEMDSAQAAAELFPTMPAGVAAAIIAGHAAMITHPEPVTDTVRHLLGRPALTFAQWARDHVEDFTGRR